MKTLAFRSITITAILSMISWSWVGAQSENSLGRIAGKVIDGGSGDALEFATISILNAVDSLVVAGGVTDRSGSFKIPLDPGRFLVKVEYISYRERWFEGVEISSGVPNVDFGKIAMVPNAEMLEEVEVRAEKSQLQMAFDKKVFNVGKDLATTSSNAAELLDNIPSVTVDMEGSVSLRGNEGVRILVDGKPSGLVGLRGSDGLRSLQANLIDRVEVITNPSARYEAEGMAGIINIILKKDRKKGLNGSFDVNTGHPHRHGAAVNLNFRRKKINLFTNYGLSWRRGPADDSRYQEFYGDDGTRFVDQFRDRERTGWSNNIRFGADYFIDPRNTLTGSFLYRYGNDESFSKITYHNYFQDFPGNPTSINTRTQDEVETEPNLEYALNYKRTFNKKDQELTTSIKYRNSTESEDADYQEAFFDPNFNPADLPDLRQRSANDEGEISTLIQSDYIHPFGKEGKFEAGYRGSFRRIDNDYLIEEFADDNWFTLTNLSNNFNYDENIHALYAIIGNKVGKFSYQFGLRAEHSEVLTELLQTDEVNDRSYTNLFPSSFLNYDLPGQNSVQISYSRRLRRPDFRDLNPFFTFSDSRNIRRGNPNLDPEFTNSFELIHIKYWEKSNISSSLYYRHTTGVINRVQTLQQDGDQLTTLSQPENLATRDAYGFEFILSSEPTDWLRVNSSLNFYRAITDGSNIDRSFEADTYSMFGRINSRSTFWKKIIMQMSLFYQAPYETTQGRRKSMAAMDIGFSRDILEKKGTLTFNVRDLFNSRRYRFETFGPEFYSSGNFRRRVRQLTLTFNYRLNQQKRQRGRNGGRAQGPAGEPEF